MGWQVAQRCRSQDNTKEPSVMNTALTTKSRNMINSAVELLKNDKEKEEASLEALMRCLRLAGVVKKQGERPEFTWFKLVEWLQVEYVEIFGSYMHHRPWYQFPFGGMMKEYFSILMKEMKIVLKHHGLVKAALSTAFLTDFIPGVVMSLLFGQLGALALPIRAVLGDEYSPEMQASQFETLIVTSNERTDQDWKNIDSSITAESLVKGLYKLKVPGLGSFTDTIVNLALECVDARILTITDHTEVQMKVSFEAANREEFLIQKLRFDHLEGVTVKFDYTLPTVGQHPDEDLPHYVSLGIDVVHLLGAVREISKLAVKIDQIYDFWT